MGSARRYVVIRARVIDVGLEQGCGRKQAPVEQLPLGADLHAARLLRRHVDECGADAVVLGAGGIELASDRALRRCVRDVEARDRDRLVNDADVPAEQVGLNLGGVVCGICGVSVERGDARRPDRAEVVEPDAGVDDPLLRTDAPYRSGRFRPFDRCVVDSAFCRGSYRSGLYGLGGNGRDSVELVGHIVAIPIDFLASDLHAGHQVVLEGCR